MNNRTFEFRAWHIGERKMYNQVCVMLCPKELREYRVFSSSDGDFLGNDKHFELMQFIGLLDKHKNKVFEGDVVRSEFGYIGIIKFTNQHERAMFIISWDDGDECMLFNDAAHGEIEIIGNRFEHPHLIENK